MDEVSRVTSKFLRFCRLVSFGGKNKSLPDFKTSKKLIWIMVIKIKRKAHITFCFYPIVQVFECAKVSQGVFNKSDFL